jgi:uncharacterized membrane protein required for colicin V production
MFWDGLLLAIFAYNVLRSARRGGRAVGIELAAFALTYAATVSLSPWLTQWVRAHMASPPPFLSLLSILAVFFLARRLLRVTFRPFLLPPLREQWRCAPQSSGSRGLGAGLGCLRGAVVVAAVALIGCNVAMLQKASFLQSIPAARESMVIRGAEGFVDVLVARYTRDAGPTTRQLVDLGLHPENAKTRALLDGPFVDRLKQSNEVQDLLRDQDFRQLVEARRTAEMITHPAFLRVVSLTLQELRNEKPVQDPSVFSMNTTGS